MQVNKIKITENFSLHEFECPCCRTVKVNPQLAERLQDLRKYLGAPLIINSAYRCETHNEKVGGVLNSRHTQGTAADVRMPAQRQEDFRALAEWCGFKKIILYKEKNFVHLEV